MNSNQTPAETTVRQSTYSLLVSSEEKERNLFETAIYALFILCAVFSVWQFVQHPVTIPARVGATTVQATSADVTALRS